jgi:hypothetical protein
VDLPVICLDIVVRGGRTEEGVIFYMSIDCWIDGEMSRVVLISHD